MPCNIYDGLPLGVGGEQQLATSIFYHDDEGMLSGDDVICTLFYDAVRIYYVTCMC